MEVHKNSNKKPLNEINVTPFVDVMLVLLIIFMVTAPMMHQGFQVNLPEIRSSSGSSVPQDPFILVVKKNGQIFLKEKRVPISKLSKRLSSIFKNRKDKQIYIQADKKTEYGSVAEAMGEVRSAGLTQINLVTYPKHR